MILPNFREEKRLWKSGAQLIAGIDEVGRGALAGPVVACAVLIKEPSVFFKDQLLKNLAIRDSKLLSPSQRIHIYNALRHHPNLEVAFGQASNTVIDRINIRRATILAMTRAVKQLKRQPAILLIDGIEVLPVRHRQKTFVGGDARIGLISIASILAKVTRDRIMSRLAKAHPGYGLEVHKGYGTRAHMRSIRRLGPAPFHRKSFGELKISY